MPTLCDFCDEKPGKLKCAGCFKKVYCSRECQRGSWGLHKFSCNPNALTTADYLRQACFDDSLPEHKQTRIDFGFQRAFSAKNQSSLLGLYAGLMKYHEIPAKTLNRWRKRGILIQEIKKFYEALPAYNRGGYYPWFLGNLWVLDGKTPEEWGMEQAETDLAVRAARAGWIYSGGTPTATDSQIRSCVSKWSRNRKDCWDFCGMLLTNTRPGPDSDLWISFGFCTDRVDGGEQSIAQKYHELLDLCTFDEFLLAYESSQLRELFRSIQIHVDIVHQNLGGLLQTSPITISSVWKLKQFILQETTETRMPSLQLPCKSVMVDYGFSNCKTIDEIEDLKTVYKTFFEDRNCKPPELHQACIEGRLFDYISRLVKLSGEKNLEYKRLMTNPYPVWGDASNSSPLLLLDANQPLRSSSLTGINSAFDTQTNYHPMLCNCHLNSSPSLGGGNVPRWLGIRILQVFVRAANPSARLDIIDNSPLLLGPPPLPDENRDSNKSHHSKPELVLDGHDPLLPPSSNSIPSLSDGSDPSALPSDEAKFHPSESPRPSSDADESDYPWWSVLAGASVAAIGLNALRRAFRG